MMLICWCFKCIYLFKEVTTTAIQVLTKIWAHKLWKLMDKVPVRHKEHLSPQITEAACCTHKQVLLAEINFKANSLPVSSIYC